MSKIDELIQECCPDGVDFCELSTITVSIRTGLNPRKNFKLNSPDSQNYYVTVKEITSGKVKFSDKTDKIDDEAIRIIQARSRLELGDVLFSGIGTIGKVAIVDFPVDNWNCSESIFLIKPKVSLIEPKFLMYILSSDVAKNQYESQSVGSTLKGVRMATLASLKIPIPPLKVQKEIVNILDKFTQLEAELEARRRQYEFYRNQLFTFDESKNQAKWLTLGEIGEFVRGSGLQKKDFTKNGFPCIHYGQIYTYYGTSATKTKSFVSQELAMKLRHARKGNILIAGTSENIEDVCKPCCWLGSEDVAISGDMFAFQPNKNINGKFITYMLQTKKFFDHKKKYANGTKVIRVSVANLKKFEIPVPSIEEQDRVVAILDKFDALVNDISSGLPAEIAARRKQYEYYRTKLLTFKELVN